MSGWSAAGPHCMAWVARSLVAPTQYTATAEAPFDLSVPDTLFGLNLNEILDGQRAGGATGAITPTGYILPALPTP
jgi:hypothetical protein